ncbi:MAG: sigma-70 family RNA polymerase sigma factor [Oscillospiraceae bacterium]|nr:sigma-70 family RNA polymerase sigma factor [Oscillospiraceae bacterium]
MELVLKEFEHLTDEELILRSRREDGRAEEVLVLRYVPYVRSLARPYFLAGGDFEDLIQEGMIGLINALSTFNAKEQTTFKTYATLCIRNRLYSAIRKAMRGNNSPLNNYVSIEDANIGEAVDPVDEIIGKEAYKELLGKVSELLSKFEQKVLELYLEGLSYSEISVRVSKPQKAVDNAVQRIRRKFSEITK